MRSGQLLHSFTIERVQPLTFERITHCGVGFRSLAHTQLVIRGDGLLCIQCAADQLNV